MHQKSNHQSLYIKWFGVWKVDSSLFLLVVTCGWIVFYFVDIVIVIIVFINNLDIFFLWFHRLISSISTNSRWYWKLSVSVTSTTLWRGLHFHSSSYRARCDTSDNVFLDLLNCRYSIYITNCNSLYVINDFIIKSCRIFLKYMKHTISVVW
jgi:hypothetical protein